MSWYRASWAADDSEPVQATLNRLYSYEHDVTTKVLHRARLNLFVELLRDIPGRGAALDVGCSAGAYAQILVDAGFAPVVGIDIDEEAIAAGKEQFPGVEFRLQPAEELQEHDRYALALCTEVLEHTGDPRRVVDAIERALVPGGVAIFSLPNAFSLPYAHAALAARLRGRTLDPELRDHLRFPFYRTLRLLDRPGLTRVRTAGANVLLDPTLLVAVHGRRGFATLGAVNGRLARSWPLRYAAQFFFVVVRKRPVRRADAAAFPNAPG